MKKAVKSSTCMQGLSTLRGTTSDYKYKLSTEICLAPGPVIIGYDTEVEAGARFTCLRAHKTVLLIYTVS